MGKPKAPAAPDYAAAATNQGKANVDSAVASNFLNQVNQVGPDGSLTYSYDQNKGYTDPTTGKFIPQTTATTSLSPGQQHLYDQNNQIATALNDQAIAGIGYVKDATSSPLTSGQFGQLETGPQVDPSKYVNGVPTSSLNAGAYATKAPTDLATSYDFSGVGKMPSSDDFGAQRDQVTNALMARLQPQIDQDRNSLESKLVNQGIGLGTQAYGTANQLNEQNVNDQRMSAVLAGSSEQQRLFNDAMGIRQQGVGEAMSQGDFGNAAKTSMFNMGLAANNQNFGQQATANDQNYSQAMGNAQMNNQNQAQMFNQGLASSQFTNQSIAQAIQQADYFKNQPLNMLNALRSGNQVQMPQFGSVGGGSNIAAAPIYAATNDAATAANDAYKNQMAGYSSMLSGLGSLGGAGIAKYSDRRLKENIRKLWTTISGLGVYSFNYIGGKSDIGYMADEVRKVYPAAVTLDPNGFAMVNYGMVR